MTTPKDQPSLTTCAAGLLRNANELYQVFRKIHAIELYMVKSVFIGVYHKQNHHLVRMPSLSLRAYALRL